MKALKGPAPLALAATLLAAACGAGGDDPSKVEASLRQYLSTVVPEETGFPLGAGVPRVRERRGKKIPTEVFSSHIPKGFPKGLSGWTCVVTLKRATLPTLVVLKRNGEVLAAYPGASREFMATTPPPPPPTVYEGGPEKPKP